MSNVPCDPSADAIDGAVGRVDLAFTQDGDAALERLSVGQAAMRQLLHGLADYLARLEEADSITAAHVRAAARVVTGNASSGDPDIEHHEAIEQLAVSGAPWPVSAPPAATPFGPGWRPKTLAAPAVVAALLCVTAAGVWFAPGHRVETPPVADSVAVTPPQDGPATMKLATAAPEQPAALLNPEPERTVEPAPPAVASAPPAAAMPVPPAVVPTTPTPDASPAPRRSVAERMPPAIPQKRALARASRRQEHDTRGPGQYWAEPASSPAGYAAQQPADGMSRLQAELHSFGRTWNPEPEPPSARQPHHYIGSYVLGPDGVRYFVPEP